MLYQIKYQVGGWGIPEYNVGMTKQCSCTTDVCYNVSVELGSTGTDLSNFGNAANTKLKKNGTICKHCILVGKLFPTGYGLKTLKPLYMYTGTEQVRK